MPTSQQNASTHHRLWYKLDSCHGLCQLHATMQLQRPPHTHRGRILRFADADTVVVLIEGLWGIWTERYLRLLNIESWELDGPDQLKAEHARDELNRLLENRDVLVHLRTHGHDKYGRLRGQITVGETDLSQRIVELGFAWHCAAKDSAAQHAHRHAATAAAAIIVTGCIQAREGSTLVFTNHSSTNTLETVVHQTATSSPSHLAWVAATLVAIGAVWGIGYLVHHRAKLLGIVSKIGGL